jgi:hypothetical protein
LERLFWGDGRVADHFVIFGVGCAVLMMCLAAAFFGLIESDYPNDTESEAARRRKG